MFFDLADKVLEDVQALPVVAFCDAGDFFGDDFEIALAYLEVVEFLAALLHEVRAWIAPDKNGARPVEGAIPALNKFSGFNYLFFRKYCLFTDF